MSDKVLISYAPMADFSTAPWGVLQVIDGKVTLNKPKAFNRARRMLNAGANMFRVLRRGVWSTEVPFDWEDAGYFDRLREYVGILHQPYQNGGTGSGAIVQVEVFDGCSETWMYDQANYEKARRLMRAMFANLGDLPYVRFGVGNEMNQAESVAFVREVAYPEFKAAGLKPISLGAMYSRNEDVLEKQKAEASLAWDDETSFAIYRPVHGVRDKGSVFLTDTIDYWVINGNPLAVFWSADGVFDGANECDYYGNQRRPSPAEFKSAVKYALDLAPSFYLADKQVKYGFEYLPKAVNKDDCSARGVAAISDAYFDKWKKRPENWEKYPEDWKEPEPPTPPDPPTPPSPPRCKCAYWLTEPKRPDVWRWIKCIFGGKKRCK